MGFIPDGREFLGQTTVSKRLLRVKAEKLASYASPDRTLCVFAPEDARCHCDSRVEFCSLESAFDFLDSIPAGKWLINKMLSYG